MLEFILQSFRIDRSPFSTMHSDVRRHLKPAKSSRRSFPRNLACAAFLLSTQFLLADPLKPIDLWPSKAPGESTEIGGEQDTTKPSDNLVAGRRLARIGNVSKPTLTVYPSNPAAASRAAVIVCPGGGYNILAYDLEGTEVCEWLNSIGVTAVLLKYRVPKRPGLEKHAAAFQDLQRAIGIVRLNAAAWNVDTSRIGVLGFSAGGHLAAMLSNNFTERTYPRLDDADDQSCRPNFAFLIYPGYLTVKEKQDAIAPELAITSQTPPTFLVMSQDDGVRVENALFYYLALKNAKVPAELHLYPTGGHGYGLRPSNHTVTTWPQRAAEWMRASGWLGP